MSVPAQFRQFAQDFATEFHARAARLQHEVFELEGAAAKKKAELEAANLAHERATNFQITIGGYYQCPHCWVANGTQSSLRTADGGGEREDIFHCGTCRRDYSIRV